MKYNVAIGDVHGCKNELVELLTELTPFQNRNDVQWIFLGDYVDRGPDVLGVIDHLIKFSKNNQCIFLRGNHEDMLFDAEKGIDLEHSLKHGGHETRQSYLSD